MHRSRSGACIRCGRWVIARQAHGGWAESLEMEVGAGHAPLRQCGHQAFHHAGRAAEVKLVQAGRQRPLEQGQVHVAGVLVIRPLQVLGQRPAVDHVQTEWGMRFCHVFQHCFVGLFGTVAYAVIQVHRALGLVFGAPA